MQHPAKIQFSEAEQSLMQNADWILTKNAIMEKMKWLLQQCQDAQSDVYKTNQSVFPGEIFNTPPKISKGENYLGLPWLMLDYPRHFEKEKVFAIRSFFWWGNFFSITLHLSGNYKKLYEEKIISNFEMLQRKNFYLGTSEDEWSHHIEKTNYTNLHELTSAMFNANLRERNFIKLAIKVDLSQWESLPSYSTNFNKILLEILA
jgi:hypothetical protein